MQGCSCEYTNRFILLVLPSNYYIIFYTNNSEPTFAPPCALIGWCWSVGQAKFFKCMNPKAKLQQIQAEEEIGRGVYMPLFLCFLPKGN